MVTVVLGPRGHHHAHLVVGDHHHDEVLIQIAHPHLARATHAAAMPGHAVTAPTLGQAAGASPKRDREDASRGQLQKGWPSESSWAWIGVGHRFDTARIPSISKLAMGQQVV
ncbi:MAG: hypothetical protein R6W06_02810 [Prochlorococcaceae cyanobacterium]